MNPDIALLINDLTELAKSWRLRGFDSNQMIAALTLAALTACVGGGMTRDQFMLLVDHHYGIANHVRPTVQA